MSDTQFDPNRLSFEEGVERIRRAVEGAQVTVEGKILTSRDDSARQLRKALAVDNIPDGFTKWQLPFYLDCPSQLYMTVAQSGASAPSHSHDEGAGVRFIVAGSIVYEGQELTAGDWMFIPAGAPYSFEVGELGAVMCYCYCCSCA